MAKKKYKVKPNESFATFQNPQQVMSLNPGVASLSPGQTIWTPTPTPQNPNILQGLLPMNPGSPPGSFRPGGQPPAQTPASFGGSFYSGSQVNTGAFNVGPPQINPVFANQPEFMNQNRPPVTPASPGNSNRSARPGDMIAAQAAAMTAANNTPAPTSVTLPPNYVYTGGNDDASIAQRTQWNLAAGATPEEAARLAEQRVFVMTREQKKSIGDAKRRKRGQTQQQLDTRAAAQAVVTADVIPQGHTVNSSLSWRVG